MAKMAITDVDGIKQHKRITLVLNDTTHQFKLNVQNPALKAFDLIAVRPVNEKAFASACKDAEVDLISLPLTERLPYNLKHTTLNLATSRGLFLELQYAPAIRDSTCRRNLISNLILLIRATRNTHHLVIASGAQHALELRPMHDVENLLVVMGVKRKDQVQKGIREHPRKALLHAHDRLHVCASAIVPLKRAFEEDEA